jgi:hypothetical protein
MQTPLEVLVVETEQGAAGETVELLERAGHHVHRCHEPGAPAFPCAAVTDRSECPVEGRGVDVAVTVRSRPRSQPSPLEDGLTCAIKRHVPVVIAGNAALHPFDDYVAEVAEHGDVVAAVERAANAPLVRHEAAARAALGALLEIHGMPDGGGGALVRRSLGGLAVTVTVPAGLDRSARDMAAVRVVSALREVDPDAAGIDVEVVAPD